MKLRKPATTATEPPRRPDREHLRRLVETIARQGAYDWDPITRTGTGATTAAWDELAALVDIPDGRPSEPVYMLRLHRPILDSVDGLTDRLLTEFDERAGELAAE